MARRIILWCGCRDAVGDHYNRFKNEKLTSSHPNTQEVKSLLPVWKAMLGWHLEDWRKHNGCSKECANCIMIRTDIGG